MLQEPATGAHSERNTVYYLFIAFALRLVEPWAMSSCGVPQQEWQLLFGHACWQVFRGSAEFAEAVDVSG